MILRRGWGFRLTAGAAFFMAAVMVTTHVVKPQKLSRLVMAAGCIITGVDCLKRIRLWDRLGHAPPPSLRRPGTPGPTTSPAARPASGTPSRPRRPDKTLDGLDSGVFAPLSDAEIKRRAKSHGLGGSWFQMLGMRGRIPPVTDERTLLIDRALVAHGLLSPEELVKIHETGAEYEKLRPSFQAKQQAEIQAGQQALEDDDAARAAAREAKKAAAAERREKRADAIAERRRTDIVFLGRGVSGGLADRRANVERLAAFGLPVLNEPADIARALGLTVPRLRWLAFHSEASEISHYIRFTIAKKCGGVRELAAPHRDMAAAQEWILRNILDLLPVRDCAHGFVRGRNVMTNAVPHVRRDAVVNADLKDFFPTITFPRVRGIFESLGYSPAAASVLALICTESPRRLVDYDGQKLHVATGPRALPQGACTSPALSNMASRKLDARLEGLSRKTGWTYTRYADDLTFSASGKTNADYARLLYSLRQWCGEEGFTVNEKKTRVQRPNTRQSVTGVVVNQRPNVPRALRRRLRAILHNARTTGLAAQNTENHPNFALWLRGMIAWVYSTNPGEGRKLLEALGGLR
ncbi:MAG: reverse transcriptase family protein [Verrucomicrobiota bacterium]